jgi:hypothetical protein
MKSKLFGQMLFLAALAVLLGPHEGADACGFKRVNMATPPTYAQVHAAATRGKIFIYGDVVDKKLEFALKKAGHQVTRTSDETKARNADVVVSSQDCVDIVQDQVKGSGTVIVVALGGAQGSPGGVQYVIRDGQRTSDQVATLDEAIRRAKTR